jgi:hypothetical protein
MNSMLQMILFVGGGLIALLVLCLLLRWILVRYANSQPQHLPWVVREMDQKAREHNKCIIQTSFEDTELPDVQIQLVNASCENGLPHTSDANTIRLSEDVWNSANRDSTLRHERIHILQRRFPEAWARFYKEKWGYELFTEPPPSFPVGDIQRVRSNPDTATEPWAVWQNRYWIAPLYSDIHAPKLLGVNIQIWDAQEMRWIQKMPDEWGAFFCGDGKCPHQWEHPHEIAAEVWTSSAFHTPAGHFLKDFVPTLSDNLD